jgi:hypothetical protein
VQLPMPGMLQGFADHAHRSNPPNTIDAKRWSILTTPRQGAMLGGMALAATNDETPPLPTMCRLITTHAGQPEA